MSGVMRSWCFDSVYSGGEYDREYGSAIIREVIKRLVGNGIYINTASNLAVLAASGMNISVQAGACWVQGAYGCLDSVVTLTVPTSSAQQNLYVVARFDTAADKRSIEVKIDTQRYSSANKHDLVLATLSVPAGATTITQSMITDRRMDKNYCGIVTGVIDQIDATGLFAQFTDAFNTWFASTREHLTEDVAGHLLSLIEENSDAIDDLQSGKANTVHTHALLKIGDKEYDGSAGVTVDNASTSVYGLTKLSNSTSSTATNLAATPSAVKSAYDLANGKASANHTHTRTSLGAEGRTKYYSGSLGTTPQSVSVDAGAKFAIVQFYYSNNPASYPGQSGAFILPNDDSSRIIYFNSVDISLYITAKFNGSRVNFLKSQGGSMASAKYDIIAFYD